METMISSCNNDCALAWSAVAKLFHAATAGAAEAAGAVTAKSGVESYVLSSGGANNLTVTGTTGITGNAANATTVSIGGNTVGGTWSLGNASDVIDATSGANISGVNSGSATTAENLTLTGGIIMTQAQHQGITAITAAGGSDFVTVTTGGAITARAAVETYTVSSVASNNVTVTATTTCGAVEVFIQKDTIGVSRVRSV